MDSLVAFRSRYSKMNNQTRWIKDSIPSWQKILQESIEKGDTRRKDYAEWMLKDVLKYRG